MWQQFTHCTRASFDIVGNKLDKSWIASFTAAFFTLALISLTPINKDKIANPVRVISSFR
jgi:hypothetical protein